MYEAFFGFQQRPFAAVPSVHFYSPVESLEQAKSNLIRAVDRAEGIGLIVGPAGTGKSLLCNLLAEHFRQQFQIAMLSSTRLCSRRALLQNILFELKLPYRDMEEGELRLSLIDHLEPSDRCPRGALLIVDEAHVLPLRLLEEVRMITNLVRGGQPRVRLLLAGDPRLEERLASPRLASFQQRIAVRCYLHHMSQSETAQMVRQQLRLAGVNSAHIFDEGALAALHQATDGIPRLVNQVCDHALVLAYAGGRRTVDARGIEEAWADLQQLPTPWSARQEDARQLPAVIEFGQLEDDELDQGQDFDEQFSRQRLSNDQHPSPVFDDAEEDLEFELPEFAEQHGGNEKPLAAPLAADPFGGPFADEELVLDRVASWDSQLRRRPHVRSLEGEQIAAALRSTSGVQQLANVEDSLASSVQQLQHAAQEAMGVNDSPAAAAQESAPPSESRRSAAADYETSGIVATPPLVDGFAAWDPQLWTAHVLPPTNDEMTSQAVEQQSPHATHKTWIDDRDMVIVEDAPLSSLNAHGTQRALRVSYRQVLEQLRDS